MTDPLSNLPQEVREALNMIRPDDGRPNSILHTQYVAWQTIRAELVRVTNELAALRKRIADAPLFECEASIISGRRQDYIEATLQHDNPGFQYPDLNNKRVRLVLDEAEGE